MSWNANATIKPGENPAEVLDDLVPEGNDQEPKERDQQLRAAKVAALAVIEDGCMGVLDTSGARGISVTLSGHANPKFETHERNPDNHISIHVGRTNIIS